MSSGSPNEPFAGGSPAGPVLADPDGGERGALSRLLDRLLPWRLKRRLDHFRTDFAVLRKEVGSLREHVGVQDDRSGRLELRCNAGEDGLRAVQDEIGALRDVRAVGLERRLDEMGVAQQDLARVRDVALPAAVARADALIDRLSVELEELGSLVERMLRKEPLPSPVLASAEEDVLASGLAEVQPLLVEAFRGSEQEIAHRLDRYLPELADGAPVLDLGCGRGELLCLLRDAGVEAAGIEADGALAQAARRRGLRVLEGDVVAVLRQQGAAAWGGVTAMHLLEHIPPQNLPALLAEVRRVLRPGGVLVVESPNPHTLRVGASLYWLDPTHQRPLLPETLELLLRAGGFEIRRTERLHPFPAEQQLTAGRDDPAGELAAGVAELGDRLDRLTRRLDELLNGPRDFAVVAVKPSATDATNPA